MRPGSKLRLTFPLRNGFRRSSYFLLPLFLLLSSNYVTETQAKIDSQVKHPEGKKQPTPYDEHPLQKVKQPTMLDDYSKPKLRTSQTKYPYNIVIDEIISGERFLLCGGVLIQNQVVLTSASCFDHKTEDQILVGDKFGRGRKVESIIRHPRYVKGSYYHDIAMLKLFKPLRLNVTLIASPAGYFYDDVLTSSQMLVTDWNDNENFEGIKDDRSNANPNSLPNSYTNGLKNYGPSYSTRLPVLFESRLVNITECEEYYRSYFQEQMLAFDLYFPNGIVGNRLLCVAVNYDTNCLEFGGFQLLTSVPSPLDLNSSSTEPDNITPAFEYRDDESLGVVKSYDMNSIRLIGTRAQALSGLIGASKCDQNPWAETWTLPTLYTHSVEYTGWIEYVIEDLKFNQ